MYESFTYTNYYTVLSFTVADRLLLTRCMCTIASKKDWKSKWNNVVSNLFINKTNKGLHILDLLDGVMILHVTHCFFKGVSFTVDVPCYTIYICIIKIYVQYTVSIFAR